MFLPAISGAAAVPRLQNTAASLAKVATGHDAQAADQPRAQIADDVPIKFSVSQDIESRWVCTSRMHPASMINLFVVDVRIFIFNESAGRN